jgi:predicted GNAT family N-acyltransferase
MSKPPIRIVQTTLERILELRHRILRAGLPLDTAIFPGDEAPTSLHIAAVLGDEVVGCATFHLNQWQGQPAWQLRGMATSDAVRRQGLGRKMLEFAERELQLRQPTRQLWCNARTPAVPFYEAMGWTVESQVFEIPSAGPHVEMSKRMDRPGQD